ncbi:MAG: NFACT RNA binding domain-containing protein [Campylobacter sp.]
MKYAHLKQIEEFLCKFKKISDIKRVGDMLILADFDGEKIFFDLAKSGSCIYKNDEFIVSKIYNAPFDNILKKRLKSAKIISVKCLENNRILKFICELQGSYKSVKTNLYLEFTGRFTNAIITDENEKILEALRHTQNSDRIIKPNHALTQLKPIQIKEKNVALISNFDEFFKAEFLSLNELNLQNLRQIKTMQISKKINTLKENLNLLEDENELGQQCENLRHKASVLLANLNDIGEHERIFKLTDFDKSEIEFALENTPKISVNEFYSKAKRLSAKALGVSLERENLKEKINFLTSLKELINEAKSANEIEILSPKKTKSKKDKDQNQNIENFYINEYKISVGRNEKGNIWLLKNSKKDDIWLHIKDLPSAHVIIKSQKMSVDDKILEFAAKLCVNFSVNYAGKFQVDFTRRNNVKIISGANVNYINYKTIIISKGV